MMLVQTVDTVPIRRSSTSLSNTFPIKDLREVPINRGLFNDLKAFKRLTISRLFSSVLPNPMPGSIMILSDFIPISNLGFRVFIL